MLLTLISALDAFAPPRKASLVEGQGTLPMINILMLPDEILGMIMSHLTYDEVSRIRLVCTKFNFVSKQTLNRGFFRVVKYHTGIMKKFKEQLPRRESERQKHPLSTHCDVLTALDNRLSLMGMTYVKFIDLNKCCFIPGKVLDELLKILRLVENSTSLLKPHIVLAEFRDITTMAMEHFEEHIAPGFDISKGSGPKLKLACFDTLGAPSCRYGYIQVRCKETAEFDRKLAIIRRSHKQSKRKLNKARRGHFAVRRKNVLLRKEMILCSAKISALKRSVEEQCGRSAEQEVLVRELETKFARYEEAATQLASSLSQLKNRNPKNSRLSTIIDKCLNYLGDPARNVPTVQLKRKAESSLQNGKIKCSCISKHVE